MQINFPFSHGETEATEIDQVYFPFSGWFTLQAVGLLPFTVCRLRTEKRRSRSLSRFLSCFYKDCHCRPLAFCRLPFAVFARRNGDHGDNPYVVGANANHGQSSESVGLSPFTVCRLRTEERRSRSLSRFLSCFYKDCHCRPLTVIRSPFAVSLSPCSPVPL